MTELGTSLERMSFMQLLLLFGFIACYVMALGGMFGSKVRLHAAALALLQGVAFTALSAPWVHGALLVVFVVGGLGLFVVSSWLLAHLLGLRQVRVPPETPPEPARDIATPPSQPLRQGDALGTAPKLAAQRVAG